MSEKEKPELKFIHHEKGDFLEATIGKLLGVPSQHLFQGTYTSIFKDVPKENINWLAEKFKDVEWQGDVEVHLNHSPFFGQMKRLFENERPRSLFSRVVFGIPVTLWNSLAGKLMNWNLYNPYADVVQLFSENKYSNLAKVNVAEFIHQKSEKNSLWQEALSFANSIPFVLNTLLFFKTNREAMKKLDVDEFDEGSRILNSSTWSEGIIDSFAILASLAGLQELDIPDNIKEAIDLSIYEQMGLGIGVAGGISLYSELTKGEEIKPHDFFDEQVNTDTVKKTKKKEKNRMLNPGGELQKLVA